MNKIEKIGLINKASLNEGQYFSSLMEQAYDCSLLSDVDVEKIQVKCFELLAYKIDQYTSGASSSIQVGIAENIMQSNLYVIGVYLKSFPCPDDAVNAIVQSDIKKIYDAGRKLIDTKLKTTRHYHLLVTKNMLDTTNTAYNDTLVGGIKGFFKLYNPDFEADRIHITVDYPLCKPIESLTGIEFIQKYLESVNYENSFCRCFPHEAIHHLLCGYNKNYDELIFNLFEPMLTSSLGCILAKNSALNLDLTAAQVNNLQEMLRGKSSEEIQDILLDAFDKLTIELSLTSGSLKNYIKSILNNVALTVFNAVKISQLTNVFIVPSYHEQGEDFVFSFGEKMPDEEYRKVIDEIFECDLIADKINIIKTKINSLADLEDLLSDSELEAEEISTVLNHLTPIEVAALAKKHPLVSGIDALDLNEFETTLRMCLNQYITTIR